MGARFSAHPDQPWGPPSLLYNGYPVFPGSRVQPGRDADHSPPSSPEVFKEESYTSTPLWAITGPVMGLLYLFYMYMFRAISCSSSGGQIVLIQHLVLSLSVSVRLVLCTGQSLTNSDDTRCCTNTI